MTQLGRRLRNRIDILRKADVRSGSGFETTWPAIAKDLPAEVIGIGGREGIIEQTFQGVRFYKITIRWRGDIEQKDQVRFGSIDLNIRSADDPDGRREQLVIYADTEGALKTS